jgi:hypothetical protein
MLLWVISIVAAAVAQAASQAAISAMPYRLQLQA